MNIQPSTHPRSSTPTQHPTGQRAGGAAITATMEAVAQYRFGAPADVLTLRDLPTPKPGSGEVLVDVAAASVNALDWHYVTGEPMFARIALGWRRPKREVAGTDLAGTVVAVGEGVTAWHVGDEVFGCADDGGAFARYAVVAEGALARRPQAVELQASAALGVAAVTALQAVRDWGRLAEGQSVLVNGASGGVGTYAVQIARALGAGHVTAVCSTRNVDQARELGADDVIDYTRTPLGTAGSRGSAGGGARGSGDGPARRYDVFIDNAGSTSLRQAREMLTHTGRFVMVTSRKSRWLHPMPRMMAGPFVFMGGTRTASIGQVSETRLSDLELLARWADEGLIRPVIEARLPLSEAPAAVERQGHGHARAKTLLLPDR